MPTSLRLALGITVAQSAHSPTPRWHQTDRVLLHNDGVLRQLDVKRVEFRRLAPHAPLDSEVSCRDTARHLSTCIILYPKVLSEATVHDRGQHPRNCQFACTPVSFFLTEGSSLIFFLSGPLWFQDRQLRVVTGFGVWGYTFMYMYMYMHMYM